MTDIHNNDDITPVKSIQSTVVTSIISARYWASLSSNSLSVTEKQKSSCGGVFMVGTVRYPILTPELHIKQVAFVT